MKKILFLLVLAISVVSCKMNMNDDNSAYWRFMTNTGWQETTYNNVVLLASAVENTPVDYVNQKAPHPYVDKNIVGNTWLGNPYNTWIGYQNNIKVALVRYNNKKYEIYVLNHGKWFNRNIN